MSITWNGVSSDTIGVIVERIPNRYVPTRRFSPQQVAGRNGNILLVDKAFPNVEQEYEVYLSAEAQGLPSVARACAEWLMGPDGYCRLEDSYDTTVYREAFLMGGYDLENILNKFGRCTITFSCKPQKYLLTGDTPIEIPAGITTYTGDVVQFDGVTGASITSLSTTITPTQDLHGYSSPWPAGGGKNLLDKSKAKLYNNVARFIKFGVSAYSDTTPNGDLYLKAGTYTFSVSGDGTANYLSFKVYNSSGTSIKTQYNAKISTFTVSENGAYIITLDMGDAVDLSIYNVQLELGSTATSWEPYENICPISGRTGVEVYRTGKNLYSRENSEYNVPYYNQDGTQTQYKDVAVWWFKAKPNTKYTCSLKEAPSKITYFRWINCDTDKGFISRPESVYGSNQFPITITTPADTGWVQIAVNEYDAAQVASNDWQIQIEESETATSYEPFGNTYAVDWTTEAGTVYGGTLDVVTGLLTDKIGNITVDDFTSFVNGSSSGGLHWVEATVSVNANAEAISSMLEWKATRTAWGSATECFATENGRVRVYTSASSLSDFKTRFADLTVVYELATPLTYQLTGQEIEVLVGENNVWTSSGPVSVTVEAPFVGTVTNPTPFEARPLLEVSGVGEITINGKSIQILESVSDFDIDCESMEAEDNSKIYCMDFPYLEGGENEIAGDGSITALTVTPRWWTL